MTMYEGTAEPSGKDRNGNGAHSTRRLVISATVSAVAGVVAALVVFYIGFGYNAVSKADLRQEINLYSPYAQDRIAIRRELDDLHTQVHQLEARAASDDRSEGRIEAELAVLQRDIDRLLTLHTKG